MKRIPFAVSIVALALAALSSAPAAAAAASASSPKAAETTSAQGTMKADAGKQARQAPKHKAKHRLASHKSTTAARMKKAAHHPVSLSNGMHDRVVASRAATERRWISAELRHHRLDAMQAASLRREVAAVEDGQRKLDMQGPESVDQALHVSHEQDVLDWAIRQGRLDVSPRDVA